MKEQQVIIAISRQILTFVENNDVIFSAHISTAAKGVGEQQGSECTPRGTHIIRAKIGEACALNTVFVGRRTTGELFTTALGQQYPDRDWILTRILWLSGCERGINRLGDVDTMRRFIYIHGCPDGIEMGKPASHGCVRMTNQDVLTLFDLVKVGTTVLIKE